MTPPRKRFVLVPWFVFGSLIVCTNAFILQCPPCEYVTCPPLECMNSTSHTYFDECGCCILCGKAEGERCGGESNAGGNCVSGLSCNYRTGIVLGDERMGQCEPEDCYRHVCGYRERCSTNFFGTTDCRCSHHRCSGKSNVVCGNDGITYASVCHLQSAECSSSKFIGIHHFGMCRSSSSQPVTTSPPPATTASRNSIPDDDDLFGQLLIHTEPPEAASEAPKRCLYKNQVYNANNELIKINECLYRICNYEGILREILVPGCPGGPVEPDYGVDKYPVDGGWSSWSSWSECEGSCLNSTHYRTRTCTNPSPMYEGRNCNGDAMETQRCIPAICELSCNYSTWSPWSACSVTCGRGTQMRTRSLLTDVFDEAVCRLGDVRACSRPRCKMYNCRRRSTWKFFVNERGCRSIKVFKDYYCSGACGGSDENCCRATRYYLHRYIPMQCEGDHSYRDHDFPNQISECSCAACEEESGEGINLGEQGS